MTRTDAKAKIEKLRAIWRSSPDSPEGQNARTQADKLMAKYNFKIGAPKSAAPPGPNVTVPPRRRRRAAPTPEEQDLLDASMNLIGAFIRAADARDNDPT